MKRLITVLVAGLLVAAFALPAFAWEFSMTGEYEYRLRYYSRTGDTDLFGIAPLQENAVAPDALIAAVNPNTNAGAVTGINVGFAGPNWYNRNWGANQAGLAAAGVQGARVTETPATAATNIIVRPINAATAGYADIGTNRAAIVRGGYSTWGCDSLYSDSRLTLQPDIRVNPAIRVHGVYTVGGMRHKYFQNYIGGFGLGIGTPPLERYYMSQSSMNAYDTAAIGSWEQLRATIQLPFGIWSVGVKDFPFGTGVSFAYNTRAEAFLTVVPYGPFRLMHGIWLSRGRFGNHESWFSNPDRDTKPTLFQAAFFTYDCGALNVGGIAIYRNTHLNRAETQASGLGANGADNFDSIYMGFMKYNNGRFFAAAEYGWITSDIYRIGATPIYIEGYHWWSEIGAVAGPAKLRLLYSLASGPVLNTGSPTKSYRPWTINYQAMKPYQFLMFETYAGGNDGGWRGTDLTFVSDDHGMMSDAYCFAGRLDYAVASNLNVWGSYIWAHRLERAGWLAGQKLANGQVVAPPVYTAAAAQAWKALNTGGAAAFLNPYVDDGYLGWEANVGIDWKLLEGMNMHVAYAYWQPGDWFTQAYRAVGMRGGVAVEDGLVAGRDAIQAINGSLMINF